MIEIKKKEGESVNAFLYRFNKKLKWSGITKEIKKRRFKNRNINRHQRRLNALYRNKKEKEIKNIKKYGCAQ